MTMSPRLVTSSSGRRTPYACGLVTGRGRHSLAIGAELRVEEQALGLYVAPHLFGRAANLPSTRPRKPTDADMGPHDWGACDTAEGRR